MAKSFRQLLNEYFRFSKKDRRGVLLLISLIILFIIAIIVVNNIQFQSENDFSAFKEAIEEWESKTDSPTNYHSLFSFNPNTISKEQIDSLQLPHFIKENIISYRKAGGKFNEPADLRKIYGMNDSIYNAIEKYITIPTKKQNKAKIKKITKQTASVPKSFSGSFDPNSADSVTLKNFGFNPFQASNLINYRMSGGSFSLPADILKIYGVDSAFFLLIKNHIQIKSQSENSENTTIAANEIIPKPDNKIELNTADSTELVKLHGVGSVFASRIIKYRSMLGGFNKAEQLLEVYNFPEETYKEIEPFVYTDQEKIQKIRINFADFGELLRHPYLDNEDVKAILEYRNNNGAFQSVNQFESLRIIDTEKFTKLKPYLSCR